jgi:putative SOS response-associated peptidase YedK
MCGRFTLTVDAGDLRKAIPGLEVPDSLQPRYNIAPTQDVAVVANDGPYSVAFFRWGLIPFWAKDPKIGSQMINARAETLAEKPSFRAAFRRRRCLILADGFFEWRREPGRKAKTPMYVRLKSGQPFAFAGLWESWQSPEDETILSCTIITTTPNSLVKKIHNRMPVILVPEAYDEWLDPAERNPDELTRWLKPYPASGMIAYPISTRVNDPRNDSPDLLIPVR